MFKPIVFLAVALALSACEGPEGPQGPIGPPGPQGEQGPAGPVPTFVVSGNTQTETPYVFEGNGAQATDKFALLANTLYVLRADFELDSFFIAVLLDSNGNRVGALLNESDGTTTASVAFNVDTTGEYIINVDNVQGPWMLSIERQ